MAARGPLEPPVHGHTVSGAARPDVLRTADPTAAPGAAYCAAVPAAAVSDGDLSFGAPSAGDPSGRTRSGGAGAGPATLDGQAQVAHRFANPALLREALTHRSAAHGTASGRMRPGQKGQGSNERLEFIGDRVLGLLVAEWLAERFPDEQEGQLGPRHAQLVSRPVLARIAETAGLAGVLAVAPNEARAGVKRLATVLADTLEAVIGAIFLDAGLDAARVYVRACWADAMTAQRLPPKDPKTALQEWLLARGRPLPSYEVASREGPSHNPVFVITVGAAGHVGTGTAGSKRIAERDAALDLLAKLA